MEKSNVTLKQAMQPFANVAPSIEQIRLGNAYLRIGHTGSAVLACRRLLHAKGYACNQHGETYDEALRNTVRGFQGKYELGNDGLLGQATLAVLEDTQGDTDWFVNGETRLTAGKLARLGFRKLMLRPHFVQQLNTTCRVYNMNSKTKIRHFLAQGFVETDSGKTLTEYIYRPGRPKENYANCRYAPYCGGGFLQLTWEANYSAFYEYMKRERHIDDPRIKKPAEYATQYVADTYPFESAGWFWEVYKRLNRKIDDWSPLSAVDTVTQVTKVVNGGTNGLRERIAMYEKVKQILR